MDQENRVSLPCVVCDRVNHGRWRIRTGSGLDIAIARCGKCGHVYQCPQLDKSFGNKYFDDAYGDDDVESNPYFNSDLKLSHSMELFDALRALRPDIRRMLEVGAGEGAFLKVAKDAGIEVTGTELSRMAVRKAREAFGVDLHFGDVADLPASMRFDTVVLWDVIEHLPRPDLVLETLEERLEPGGSILLTTGNYECADRIVAGDRWWCWHPDHYHYFSPSGIESLGRRLGLVGFQTLRVVRLRAPSQGDHLAPSPLRFLNPFHVLRGVRSRTIRSWTKLRWPAHWDIGVMMCQMTKESPQVSVTT